jgi:hypothetical protein
LGAGRDHLSELRFDENDDDDDYDDYDDDRASTAIACVYCCCYGVSQTGVYDDNCSGNNVVNVVNSGKE